MKKEKKKRKWYVRLIRALVIIISAIIILCSCFILYVRIGAFSYFKNSKVAFKYPGLNENIVLQGLSDYKDSDLLFVCGYSHTGGASKVFVIDEEKGTTKAVTLKNKNDGIFKGHSGGLLVRGDYVYLAGSSDHVLYVYNKQDILNNNEAKCLGEFPIYSENDSIRVSFVGLVDNYLVVGEYYKKNSSTFATKENHHITSTTGEAFGGILIGYEFDNEKEFGLNETPKICYSLPDLAQGVCYYDGKIFVSCSSGLAFSSIYVFDETKLNKLENKTVLDTNIPCYALDKDSLIKVTKIAPMSEEIIVRNDYLYVISEAASNRYIFGKLYGATNIYKTNLELFV